VPAKKGERYPCRNMTRKEFRKHAEDLAITIGGDKVPNLARPREYKTLSLGWSTAQKIYVKVNGKWVLCQLNMNITVLGSKALPDNPEDNSDGQTAA